VALSRCAPSGPRSLTPVVMPTHHRQRPRFVGGRARRVRRGALAASSTLGGLRGQWPHYDGSSSTSTLQRLACTASGGHGKSCLAASLPRWLRPRQRVVADVHGPGPGRNANRRPARSDRVGASSSLLQSGLTDPPREGTRFRSREKASPMTRRLLAQVSASTSAGNLRSGLRPALPIAVNQPG
jgi:hypothetical protein